MYIVGDDVDVVGGVVVDVLVVVVAVVVVVDVVEIGVVVVVDVDIDAVDVGVDVVAFVVGKVDVFDHRLPGVKSELILEGR